jgi:UDP-N-acetylmuramate dehydrogenase
MIEVLRQYSLTTLNTMQLVSIAEYFVRVTTLEALKEALTFAAEKQLSWVIIGGGSNLLLPPEMPGLVIQMGISGWHLDPPLEADSESDTYKLVAGAGENWHQLVRTTVEVGLFGLENLSLIPGTVGAAPVQNIGAYGVELSDVLDSVEVLDSVDGSIQVLSATECEFAYRDSLFKRHPGRYIILRVTFCLFRSGHPVLTYPALKQALAENQAEPISPKTMSDIVISIRQSKLPDPDQIPNTGSFYKNPIVSDEAYHQLKNAYVDMPAYETNGQYKLAAGWLIEQCGWKGYRNDKVGVHDRQALVLINHHQGNLDDILALSSKIVASVKQKFNILLEIEPVNLKA